MRLRLPSPDIVTAAFGSAFGHLLFGSSGSAFTDMTTVAQLAASATAQMVSGVTVNLMSSQIARPDSRFNHDLHEASGRAIATVLGRCAAEFPHHARSLGELTQVVADAHDRKWIEASGGAELPDFDLRDHITGTGGYLKQSPLDADGWGQYLTRLADARRARIRGLKKTLSDIGRRLEKEYPDVFLLELKRDYNDSGRAFASVVLWQLDEILRQAHDANASTDAALRNQQGMARVMRVIGRDVEGLVARVEQLAVDRAEIARTTATLVRLNSFLEEQFRSVKELMDDHHADVIAALRELLAATRGRDVDDGGGSLPAAGNLGWLDTDLLGRDSDLDLCVDLLRSGKVRCVVIEAPPGVGKSMLAHRAAEVLRSDYRAWWIDETNATTADGVAIEVSDALDGPHGAGQTHQDLPGSIGNHLAGLGRELLVLDNFEDAARHAELLLRWLAAAPKIALIVTTRRHLPISSPAVKHVSLSPLARPELGDIEGMSSGELRAYPSVQVFLEGAESHGHGDLDDDRLRAAARICSRLDGFPAPIGIAASQLRALDIHAIEHHLGTLLLEVPEESGEARARRYIFHVLRQSLAALDKWEQRFIACLGQLRGPFDLDAAGRLGKPGPKKLTQVMIDLVDRQLIKRVHQRSSATIGHYSIYRPIQQYLREELWWDSNVVPAKARADFLQRYEEYLVSRTDELNRQVTIGHSQHVLDQLELLREDLLNCHALALERGDKGGSARILRAMARLFAMRGPTVVFERTIAAAIRADALPDPNTRAFTHRMHSEQLWALGRYDEAIRSSQLAVDTAETEETHLYVRAGVYSWHGRLLRSHGKVDEAARVLEAGIASYEGLARLELRDHRVRARLEQNYASCLDWMGQADAAIMHATRATEFARESGSLFAIATAENTLGIVLWHDGRAHEAVTPLESAARANEQFGNELHLAGNITNLGLALGDLGRVEEAMALFGRAEAMHLRQGNAAWNEVNTVGRARTHLDARDPDRALEVLGELGSPPMPGCREKASYDENVVLAATIRARCVRLVAGHERSIPLFHYAWQRLNAAKANNMIRCFLLATDYADSLTELHRQPETVQMLLTEAKRVALIRRLHGEHSLERVRRAWRTYIRLCST